MAKLVLYGKYKYLKITDVNITQRHLAQTKHSLWLVIGNKTRHIFLYRKIKS